MPVVEQLGQVDILNGPCLRPYMPTYLARWLYAPAACHLAKNHHSATGWAPQTNWHLTTLSPAMVKLGSHDEINRLSNGRLVISREVSLFFKSSATGVVRMCATCRWIGNQADGFLWLHTGQCVRNQGPRQSAHDFHHTMEILRRTMFDTAFPPGFTRSLTNKLIWWHSKEIKWVQKPFRADHFFDILIPSWCQKWSWCWGVKKWLCGSGESDKWY